MSKRKRQLFFAKWGGLIISAAFVLIFSAVGGLYLHANGEVSNTLAWVSRGATFETIEPWLRDDVNQIAKYKVTVRIDNLDSGQADFSMANPVIVMGGYELPIQNTEILTTAEDGSISIDGHIDGHKYVRIPMIIAPTYRMLEDMSKKDSVELRFSFNNTVKAKYSFFTKDISVPVTISTMLQIKYET